MYNFMRELLGLKNVPNWIVVIVAKLCIVSKKKNWIEYIQWVNFMVHKLYLNVVSRYHVEKRVYSVKKGYTESMSCKKAFTLSLSLSVFSHNFWRDKYIEKKYDTVLFFFKTLFIFREGGREGERGRETSMCGCLPCALYWGPGLQTPACALTGNRTSGPLVCRPLLNPLSYTSQGHTQFYFIY